MREIFFVLKDGMENYLMKYLMKYWLMEIHVEETCQNKNHRFVLQDAGVRAGWYLAPWVIEQKQHQSESP